MQKAKNVRFDNKELFLIVIESLFLTILYLRFIGDYKGFFLSEDELGYWGNAAGIAGLDWGNILEGTSYYSYGYSFILAILLKLPLKPIYIYRLAVGLNALYILIAFYSSYYIFTRLFPNISKIYISFACMSAMSYVSYVAQSGVSWPELFMVMLFWLIVLQVYLLCHNVTTLRLAIFVGEIVYIYTVHMRTLSVIFAGCLFLLFLGVENKSIYKKLVLAILGVISLFILSNGVKYIFQSQIYNAAEATNMVNDYSSILGKSFSVDMLIGFLLAALGQVYGLVVSSCGFIVVGFVGAIDCLVDKWKQKNREAFLYGFILIVFIASLFISAFFLRWSTTSRYDSFFYSRYLDNVISFLLILGMIKFGTNVNNKKKKKCLWILLCTLMVTAISISLRARIYGIPDSYYQAVCAPGIYLWFKCFGISMRRMTLAFLLLIFVLGLFMQIGEKIKKWNLLRYFGVSLVVLLWIYGGSKVITDQILAYENINLSGLSNSEVLLEKIRENNYSVTFFTTQKNNLRGNIQFYLMEIPLHYTKKWEDIIDWQSDVLIIDNEESIENIGNIYDLYELVDCIGNMTVWMRIEVIDWEYRGILENLGLTDMDLSIESQGFNVYGPYISLPAGQYQIVYELEIEPNVPGDSIEIGFIDVVAGEQEFALQRCISSQNSYTLNVDLMNSVKNIEFRVYKNSGCKIELKQLHVIFGN